MLLFKTFLFTIAFFAVFPSNSSRRPEWHPSPDVSPIHPWSRQRTECSRTFSILGEPRVVRRALGNGGLIGLICSLSLTDSVVVLFDSDS